MRKSYKYFEIFSIFENSNLSLFSIDYNPAKTIDNSSWLSAPG